jgi:C_GCAxxG_C_C family probable redox protein
MERGAGLSEQAAARARALFESGYCCAESVLMAVAEDLGVQSDLIPKIATGFCGGMARTCGMCGALSGAIMGIGLLTGRKSERESVEANYQLVRELLAAFSREFGSTNCRELAGCDLGTDEGQQFFKENKVRERCARYVEEAARIAAGML